MGDSLTTTQGGSALSVTQDGRGLLLKSGCAPCCGACPTLHRCIPCAASGQCAIDAEDLFICTDAVCAQNGEPIVLGAVLIPFIHDGICYEPSAETVEYCFPGQTGNCQTLPPNALIAVDPNTGEPVRVFECIPREVGCQDARCSPVRYIVPIMCDGTIFDETTQLCVCAKGLGSCRMWTDGSACVILDPENTADDGYCVAVMTLQEFLAYYGATSRAYSCCADECDTASLCSSGPLYCDSRPCGSIPHCLIEVLPTCCCGEPGHNLHGVKWSVTWHYEREHIDENDHEITTKDGSCTSAVGSNTCTMNVTEVHTDFDTPSNNYTRIYPVSVDFTCGWYVGTGEPDPWDQLTKCNEDEPTLVIDFSGLSVSCRKLNMEWQSREFGEYRTYYRTTATMEPLVKAGACWGACNALGGKPPPKIGGGGTGTGGNPLLGRLLG